MSKLWKCADIRALKIFCQTALATIETSATTREKIEVFGGRIIK